MKKALLITLLIVLPAGALMSQGSRQSLLADSLYRYESYAKAVRHYEKAIKKESSPELLIGLGNSHYKLQEYESAIQAYRLAEKNDASWEVSDKLNFIEAQRILGNTEEAERLLAKWSTLPATDRYSSSIRSMDIYYMDSSIYDVRASSMNTEFAEFSPVYYRGGILFASSRSEGNTSSKKYHWNQENYLDLYYAADVSTGESDPFETNTKLHDGPVSFYMDGSRVIFTRNEKASKRKDQRQLALFEAVVGIDGAWSDIQPLSLNNTEYSVSHPAVSEDGNTLYFVSNMPGGFGGTDIYRSRRENGMWSAPENLGEDINTQGNEMFPVLYGEELFFASDGHPGMGGLDIFMAEQLGNDHFFVRNAGYPLNSTWDDFGLMTIDGRSGFLSSNRRGNDDIYSFTKDKIIAEITYVDQEGNPLDSVLTDFSGRLIPQGESGVTRIYLDRESLNELAASREAYADTAYSIQTNDEFFISRTIPLRPLTDEDMMRGVVDLYPIAVNEKTYDLFMGHGEQLMKADEGNNWKQRFVLKKNADFTSDDKIETVKGLLEGNGYTVRVHDRIEKIHFDFDKWNIRPGENEKLDRVAELLNTYPQTLVMIGAHTDERGSDQYNMKLSRKRAQSTVDYLISRGVESSRMSTQAYGESMLLIRCSPCSEEEHEQNRRVTFDVSIGD